MSSEETKPNLLAVARHAGVSPATVSRVINRTGHVSANTQSRVLAAMSALGYERPTARTETPYRVEATRQAVSTSPTAQTIATLITDILNPFFPEIVRGIEDEAEMDGVMLWLCNTAEDPQREQKALQRVVERAVDGVIVCASRLAPADLIALRERHHIPLVVISRRLEHPDIPCIVADLEGGAYRATQHLLQLKHTRIGYLAGPATAEASRVRQRGVEKSLNEAGLSLCAEWCPSCFPNVEDGFRAMSALLSSPHGHPTGVIAYNDMIALGALHAIRIHGLRVPDDISVIGFDDIAMAAHANPPLTTISQPKYRMGKLAMQLLRQLMQGHQMTGTGYTLVESPLIIRESTAVLKDSK
jgi:DNA-binding LacI/PurR family transcriptional regulator